MLSCLVLVVVLDKVSRKSYRGCQGNMVCMQQIARKALSPVNQ